MRSAQALLVAGFLLALYIPALDLYWQKLPRDESTEQRRRADFPSLRWSELPKLPAGLEAFVADHFGLRDWLIAQTNAFKLFVLQKSPVSTVIVGDARWLFYSGVDDGADIRDFQGRTPLTAPQLEARGLQLAERRAEFARRGITYLFVVVPDKQTLYPERLPLWVGPPGRSRLDQLAELARQNGSIPLLDLRPPLRAARAQPSSRNLYYPSDTHWTAYGAEVGFRAVLDELARQGRPVTQPAAEAFTYAEKPRAGGDLAKMLALERRWAETEVTMTPRVPEKMPLRVVLLGDSFGKAIHPFFEAAFVFVNPAPTAQTGIFDLTTVLAHQPDVVIEQHVERYLVRW